MWRRKFQRLKRRLERRCLFKAWSLRSRVSLGTPTTSPRTNGSVFSSPHKVSLCQPRRRSATRLSFAMSSKKQLSSTPRTGTHCTLWGSGAGPCCKLAGWNGRPRLVCLPRRPRRPTTSVARIASNPTRFIQRSTTVFFLGTYITRRRSTLRQRSGLKQPCRYRPRQNCRSASTRTLVKNWPAAKIKEESVAERKGSMSGKGIIGGWLRSWRSLPVSLIDVRKTGHLRFLQMLRMNSYLLCGTYCYRS